MNVTCGETSILLQSAEVAQTLLDDLLAYTGLEDILKCSYEISASPVLPIHFEKEGRHFKYFFYDFDCWVPAVHNNAGVAY